MDQRSELVRPSAIESQEGARDLVKCVYESPDRLPHISANIASPEQMPGKNKNQYDVRLLREIFPTEQADGSYMIGVIAIHGNEPQIMTTAIAAEINGILKEHGLKESAIVIPNVYGEATKRILREEFPSLTHQIFVSDELGEILKKTEFSKAGYQAHMRQVAEHQPQVQAELLEFLSRSFTAVSLDGKTREFSPQGRRLEINAGANVTASEPGKIETNFIFPVLLSEMIAEVIEDPVIGRYYDKKTLETVLGYALEFESTYRTTLIPVPDTLSFKYPDINAQVENYLKRGIAPTPAIKKPREPVTNDVKSGMYLMASGSGLGVEALEEQARQFEKQGLEILYPPWFNFDFGRGVLPDVIFHPGIKIVMGRPGFGILWITQVAEKPFIVVPGNWSESPEMYYNEKSVISSGIGDVISDRADLIEDLIKLGPGIGELNKKIRSLLSVPEGMDGLRYAAEKIVEREIEEKRKQLGLKDSSADSE